MDQYIGTKLDGRYEIKELIGFGGMADVYKAVDIMENKVVAVKILKKEFLGNDEFLRRFRNESKAIAVLSHPNIVKIYDVGFTDQIQYIVMEYIDGITLKEYMEQQGALKVKEAVHFTIQILRALQHAHDRGIVHRDIKPQNIMLFSDGTIKVMDFGIARFSREDGKTLSDKTIGSVHYISPEQARGDTTDEKSDIYSVGAMLYEMLTGKKPFEADTPVAVALMHMQDEPKAPHFVNPSVPMPLEEIVMHAMQKDSTKRYQSAAEMINDIETYKNNPDVEFGYSNTNISKSGDDATIFFKPLASNHQTQKKDDVEDDDEYYDDDDDVETRPSLIVPILTMVAAIVVVVATIFIAIAIIKGMEPSRNDLKMPQLEQLTLVEAQQKYPELKFDVIEEYSNVYSEGVIFEQEYPVDRLVNANDSIKIKVSKGPKMVIVQDVHNMQEQNAISTLEGDGFTVKTIQKFDDDIDKGRVIESAPSAQMQAPYQSEIIIYVSLGPTTNETVVPSVIGLTEDEAKELLKENYLIPQVERVDSEDPEGTVVSQEIQADTTTERDTLVKIYVSTGKISKRPVTLNIPIPQSSNGSYKGTFGVVCYIGANEVATGKINDPNNQESISLTIEGDGQQTVQVYISSPETYKQTELARYTVDFTTGQVIDRIAYNLSAFDTIDG